MNHKRLKIILTLICCYIIFYLIVSSVLILRIRTSPPCSQLIDFLKTDNEITDTCGEFQNASLYALGTINYETNDYSKTDKDSGTAVLKIKFKTDIGKYIITAHLTGEDGIWTVNEYELIEQP